MANHAAGDAPSTTATILTATADIFNWTTSAANSTMTDLASDSEERITTSGLYDDSRTARDWDDATWILTSSFIIFTMQSAHMAYITRFYEGFGMLESGSVNHKNEVNIMMKNVADVIFGGISYWMLGYGFSFGTDPGTNGFCGIGKFFLDPDDASMGIEYSRFVFQASFATTATTIVSGAVAERARFSTYLVFSFFNTFVFCFPAHWVWSDVGWLKNLGVVDVAGDGPVHVVGGVSALVAAVMIKPRKGRFTGEDMHAMESPVGAILGLFILWWSWLAFNCGSTFGISGGKWKIASRAATNTLMSANSGGIVAFTASYIIHRKFYVRYVINGVLASLVSITACCAVTSVKESLVIGCVGAMLTLSSDALMNKLKVDDPVSAFAVHGVSGSWGILASGLFAHKDTVALIFNDHNGLVNGGGFYLLAVQSLELVSIAGWTLVTTFILFKTLDLTIGLRLHPEEEEIGADFVEHNIVASARPRRSIALSTRREVHFNPAYDLEDELDSDHVSTMCGMTKPHSRRPTPVFIIGSATTGTANTSAASANNNNDDNDTSSRGEGRESPLSSPPLGAPRQNGHCLFAGNGSAGLESDSSGRAVTLRRSASHPREAMDHRDHGYKPSRRSYSSSSDGGSIRSSGEEREGRLLGRQESLKRHLPEGRLDSGSGEGVGRQTADGGEAHACPHSGDGVLDKEDGKIVCVKL